MSMTLDKAIKMIDKQIRTGVEKIGDGNDRQISPFFSIQCHGTFLTNMSNISRPSHLAP